MNSEVTTVLVVDDHALSRIGLRILLSQHEKLNVVAEAGDGCDAVNKAVALRPDVVLMDIGLPVKDGVQATKEIKALLPETQVIMLSGNNSAKDVVDSFAAGASGYCLKNITENQLLSAIVAASFGATWLHPDIAAHVLSSCRSTSVESDQDQIIEDDFTLLDGELEILALLSDGLSNQQIGEHLNICQKTLKSQMRHIFHKLEVSDRTQAVVKAIRRGLIKFAA